LAAAEVAAAFGLGMAGVPLLGALSCLAVFALPALLRLLFRW